MIIVDEKIAWPEPMETINGTIAPLGYPPRTLTAQEQLEQPLYGREEIADAMGISKARLK